MPTVIACPDAINYGTNGTARCSAGWQEFDYSSVVAFDPATMLDPVLIAGAVGTGFFVLVPIWVAGLGVRKLLTLIK